MSFAWKPLAQLARPVGCLFVDPTRLHPTMGRSRYINSIINASVDKHARPPVTTSIELKSAVGSVSTLTWPRLSAGGIVIADSK